MEDDAVVELVLHELLDLRDVLGRKIGAQLDDDVAVPELQDHRVLVRQSAGSGKRYGKGERKQGAPAERLHGGLVDSGARAAGAA